MRIESVKFNKTETSLTNNQRQVKPEKSGKSVNFTGKINETRLIDNVLKNKLAQKLLKLASLNPHTFNLTIMAFIGIALRPVSVLIIPGAKEEDKKYAAGKSIISAVITTATQVGLCIPLAKSVEKLAKKAEKNLEYTKFPKFNTPKFEVVNYLINNGFAVIITVLGSMAMAEAVTKIMNKILPNGKSSEKQTLQFQSNNLLQNKPEKILGGAKS